ncbi:hypothetical protein SPLC1_S207240 [Arthrospira platensis C1]|nr:hypothetical protein SPLC1_S207240 [Arthrospira platensis C1]
MAAPTLREKLWVRILYKHQKKQAKYLLCLWKNSAN